MATTYSKRSTMQLEGEVKEIHERDAARRLAGFADWQRAGFLLSELRDRHLRGKLGDGTWATYCSRLGMSRADADFYIAASETDDPAAFLERVYQLEEAREAQRRKPTTIFVKRPGVIFGYFCELDLAARREFWAMCYRHRFDKEARGVWTDLDDRGARDEDFDEARPVM